MSSYSYYIKKNINKSYCHLIEQVSCQKASANYLKEVKRSHFVSSDKVHFGFFQCLKRKKIRDQAFNFNFFYFGLL